MKKQMLFALLVLIGGQLYARKKTGEAAKEDAPELTYLVPTAEDKAVFKAAEQRMSPAERAERERRLQEFLNKHGNNK